MWLSNPLFAVTVNVPDVVAVVVRTVKVAEPFCTSPNVPVAPEGNPDTEKVTGLV